CWTQGLVYEDGILYESAGEYGKSRVLKLDAATGEILQQTSLADRYFAEGLTILDDELFLVTWLETTAFVLDKKTLDIRRTMTYRTDGWGLTTIGATLIMSDGSNRLFFLDPEDFSQEWVVTDVFGSRTLHNLNELEFDGQVLWANVLGTDYIARIKVSDGTVTAIVDGAPLRARVGGDRDSQPMNGIAYDPQTGDYFLTGKKWPTIFRVRIIET
ncbi:MAG: glutaminyl-peptide cyclotransferase, partial [bacterium]|nr:glutaminyl-peptide cyclotransferase [bacterium]